MASELPPKDLLVILHSTKSQKISSLNQLHFKEEKLNFKHSLFLLAVGQYVKKKNPK